ncbi:MAG: PGF-pre-PGF domain-containing protein [Methanomethylovorans sp.]|uniref:PGF-pre-PGF domain-containing protein n=1 Tax=Methanomethylovorans sp. TaxID=2758717 RepID=UPI00353174BC
MLLKLNSPIYFGLILFCLMMITGVSSAEKLDVSFVSQYNDLYSDNSITNDLLTQAQNFSGHYGGSVYNVAVAGNYAYVGQGQDMLVIDISDPSNPSSVGSVTTPALVNNIAVSGNYAYIANGENGLEIVDITNKTAPTIRGNYSTDSANGVAVSGNYTYIADGYNGLIIVDVSNPDVPSHEGTRNTAGYSSSVILSGNYAYVADGADGLVVIDITNPATPTIAGTCDTSGSALDVAISGNYTYVADNSSGLVIIDTANPASPIITGNVTTGDTALAVAVSGNYAYVPNNNGGLVVVNVANKASPTIAAVYTGTAGYAYDVAIAGNYAYTAFTRSGLTVVDITDPESPITEGRYDASGYASGVAVSGNYAYLAYGYMGLAIVDIANKESPTLAGSYITTGYARDVAVAGNYAYIADGNSGLVILDVTNKASPTVKGSRDTSGHAWGVTLSGNYAYVADGAGGLVIIDISNPAAPAQIGIYDTPGNAETVAIVDNYAYVADGDSGLIVVDITNKASPTLKGSYDTSGHAYGISAVNNYAYIADGSDGLVILNITDPATPAYKGNLTTNFAQSIAVLGNYAYIADDSHGLVIIDISNPASPELEDSYNTVGYGYGVTISGSYVYVADFDNGLVILHVDTIPDTTAPASVTELEAGVGSSWINWTWTNPTDEDFNYATVYIDNAFVTNTSTGYYNLTSLSEGTTHIISTRTVDTSGNINSTWVNDSASTTVSADIIPPASVTNLGETDVDPDWISWTWTNPDDADFSHVMIYLNGTFITNTTDSSISYYNATGLSEGATYTIGLKTVDSSGNINSTMVNDSAITRNYPVVSGVSGTNITKTSITLTWTASDDTTTVQISRNNVVIGNVTGSISYVDTSLTSGTTYTYTLTPYNQDGLAGEAVSVSARTTSSSSGGSSRSSSSSSGGSGGSVSVEDYTNLALKDVANAYLRINTTATYQFTKEGNPIQSISFYSLKNSGEITSTVEVLNNRSKLANSTPEGSIYQYINLWVGKAGFATPSSIKDARVQFRVNASWIQQMGISPSDVKLQRYNGTAWEVLPTTIVSNTTDYVVFESQTPGFSPFAITAEKVVTIASNENVQSNNENEVPVSNINQTDGDQKAGAQSSSVMWIIIAVILVIGFAIVGYTYLKKQK